MTKEERSRQEWEDRVIETSSYEGSQYMRQVDDEGSTDVGEGQVPGLPVLIDPDVILGNKFVITINGQ